MNEVYMQEGDAYTIVPVWSFYYGKKYNDFPKIDYNDIPTGSIMHIRKDGRWKIEIKS